METQLDLSGCWLLDPRRSDSLEEILKYHDVPWHLRKVARRVVPTVYMKHAPNQLQIQNVTSLRTIKETWAIDGKKHEIDTGRGPIFYTCRLSDDGQSLITSTSCKKLNDTEETMRSLSDDKKSLILNIRIWTHYDNPEKKMEVLKIIRTFDRVENAIDPWNSTMTAPSLAESMHVTADDSSYLHSPTSPPSASSSSTTVSTSTSGSTATLTSSAGTMSASAFLNTNPGPTTTTTTTPTGLTPQIATPKADVTPYNQFLTKIFYPNPLVQRPEATGLYKEARDLMAKFDKAFILLILALLCLHFFKRVD